MHTVQPEKYEKPIKSNDDQKVFLSDTRTGVLGRFFPLSPFRWLPPCFMPLLRTTIFHFFPCTAIFALHNLVSGYLPWSWPSGPVSEEKPLKSKKKRLCLILGKCLHERNPKMYASNNKNLILDLCLLRFLCPLGWGLTNLPLSGYPRTT